MEYSKEKDDKARKNIERYTEEKQKVWKRGPVSSYPLSFYNKEY